ncbi:hypothetical protein BYZ73_08325 [Rhodovulum viride]|uniref:Uncharacterized protein n=1 Tax=Rhodovulum viride TaxID=1231134 RepID=A0ABX9DHT7_9RHOB|nr:hypothetical protein [Rhodovulum viride]RAP41942.1 hypothetical protein BYZ73_08325 [Rhodovulum viride]
MLQKILRKLPWYVYTVLGILVLCGTYPAFQQARQEAADVAAVSGEPAPAMQTLESYVANRGDEPFHQAEFEANIDDYYFTLEKSRRRAPDTHIVVMPIFTGDDAQEAKRASGVLYFDSEEDMKAWDRSHSDEASQSRGGHWHQRIHGYEDRHPELVDMVRDTLIDDGYSLEQPFLHVRPYSGSREAALAAMATPDYGPVYVVLGVGVILLVVSFGQRLSSRKARDAANSAA